MIYLVISSAAIAMFLAIANAMARLKEIHRRWEREESISMAKRDGTNLNLEEQRAALESLLRK